MKKWIYAIIITFIIIILALYVCIPGKIAIQKSVVVNISQQAINRLLIEDSNWIKWWPGNDTTTTKKQGRQTVVFNGISYTITDKKYSSIILEIRNGYDSITTSSLNIVTVSKDQVKLEWEAQVITSTDPGKRLQRYLSAKKIENDMVTLLSQMNSFFADPVKVYGIDIRQEAVVDSTLLSTYDSIKGYPSVEFIYSLIGKLKDYTISQNARVTGNPMLNIYTKDSLIYLVKVALPIDKKLISSGKITYRWMLPGGKILVADVKGDTKTIDLAFKQVEFFVNDYNRHPPAIAFLSLVTDRLLEKDSTKWITRIYYPVME